MSKRPKKKWIDSSGLKKGALHRALGIPEGEKINLGILEEAAKASGKLGQRARFALEMRRLNKKK